MLPAAESAAVTINGVIIQLGNCHVLQESKYRNYGGDNLGEKAPKGICLAILNHKPSPGQEWELGMMGYEVRYIQHPELDPSADMDSVHSTFLGLLEGKYCPQAFWVQGDYRLFVCAYELCKAHRIPLFVATTYRQAIETKLPDGSVVKQSIFQHECFVRVV